MESAVSAEMMYLLQKAVNKMRVRKCVVAGQFYPERAEELDETISEIYNKEKNRINKELYNTDVVGGVVPHAGYFYSGYEAVHFFDILKNSTIKYDIIIIVNPSHNGIGSSIAVDSFDKWETPYGNVEIDKEFTKLLELPFSDISQKHEHSGEVMLPLLKYFLNYEFKIVPITINYQSYENSKLVADRIYEANKKMDKKIAVIASSDFSHYESPEDGIRYDNIVLEEIKTLNSRGVYEKVVNHGLTICGFGPIMTLIEYSKLVRVEPKNEILRRGSSGDVADMDKVVDYISILFY
jgi:MEMO1 family protein